MRPLLPLTLLLLISCGPGPGPGPGGMDGFQPPDASPADLSQPDLRPDGPVLTVTLKDEDDRGAKGTVTSSPPGIACPPTCSASFPSGTKVGLRAEPDARTVLIGWAGACAAAPCEVTLDRDQGVEITLRAKVCNPSGWCWEHPLPHARQLRAVFSAAPAEPDGVWLAGDFGTLMRGGTLGFRMVKSPTSQHLVSLHGSARDSLWAVGAAGTILRWNGAAWSPTPSGTTAHLNGVWAASPTDAWAVGGALLRWDGSAWKVQMPNTALNAVWGSGPSDVWAVGNSGTILRWNGASWSPSASGTTRNLLAVWGSGPKDIWAAGLNNTVVHYDGSKWTAQTLGPPIPLYGAWVAANGEAWVAANDGVRRYSGGAWSTPRPNKRRLRAAWGSAPDDVWFVGAAAHVLHWDGAAFTQVLGNTAEEAFSDVWASGPDDIWAIHNGTTRPLWRSDGRTWTRSDLTAGGTRHYGAVIWGAGKNDVWIAGNNFLHYDGASFTAVPPNNQIRDPQGMWGSGPRDIWVPEYAGRVWHYDGTSWTAAATGGVNLGRLWGSGPRDIWLAAGGGDMWHYDGVSWQNRPGITYFMYAVFGFRPTLIYAVGQNYAIQRWDGGKWTTLRDEATGTGQHESIWGSGPSDLWAAGTTAGAVGAAGIVRRFDGTSWQPSEAEAEESFYAIWGTAPGALWAVGSSQTIMRHVP